MKFSHEAGLVANLEEGLGNVHWVTAAYEPSLRLRLPVCGVTSLALVDSMNQVGIRATAVESSPDLLADLGMKHVFVQAEVNGEVVNIDPTYSQFLAYAGLSPGYVIYGGKDMFPKQKIMTFSPGRENDIAELLARTTIDFHRQRQQIEELSLNRYPMENLTHDELVEEFGKIWDPRNLDEFQPQDDDTIRLGDRLSGYILSEHVHLID